jgi:hypothetical protein
MSLPHVVFPVLMTCVMTMQVIASAEGRQREMNVTMNQFCQAHAAYEIVRSFFYVQSIGGCDEQNI